MDRPAGLATYIPVAIGFNVLKDARALIERSAAGDDAGFMAILGSTEYPLDLAGMTATIAVIACRRAGLDDDAIAALLGDAGADLADLLLDQEKPAGPAGRGEAALRQIGLAMAAAEGAQ